MPDFDIISGFRVDASKLAVNITGSLPRLESFSNGLTCSSLVYETFLSFANLAPLFLIDVVACEMADLLHDTSKTGTPPCDLAAFVSLAYLI